MKRHSPVGRGEAGDGGERGGRWSRTGAYGEEDGARELNIRVLVLRIRGEILRYRQKIGGPCGAGMGALNNDCWQV
jgi:hypothetical protein